MYLAQLLDCSPRMRTEFMRLLQKRDKLDNGVVEAVAVEAIGRISVADAKIEGDAISALDLTSPFLGFVSGTVNGEHTERLLVDGGSNMELANPAFAYRHGFRVFAMPHPITCRLADDHFSTIDRYILVAIVVGGVRAMTACWLSGEGMSYDILLGQTWLNATRAVEDHDNQQLKALR